MVAALEKYLTTCCKHGLSAGMHIIWPNQDNIRQTIADGYTLIALGLDNIFLQEGAVKSLKAARSG